MSPARASCSLAGSRERRHDVDAARGQALRSPPGPALFHWTIEFGGEPQDVTVTTTGEATPDGFVLMNAEFVEHERFRSGMLVLLDHTDLAVRGLTARDVQTIAKDFARYASALSSTVVALVTPNPVQFGLARMSTTLAEPLTTTIGVFYTRVEALGWLQEVKDARSPVSS
jgi:hypothetical protein